MMCYPKQRIGQTMTLCSGAMPQAGVSAVRAQLAPVHVILGGSSCSRARADSPTNCDEPVQSQPDSIRRRNIPERECDDATPVFLLHDHVPARHGMIPGVPPPRILDSLVIGCKTRTCVL